MRPKQNSLFSQPKVEQPSHPYGQKNPKGNPQNVNDFNQNSNHNINRNNNFNESPYNQNLFGNNGNGNGPRQY